MMWKSLGRLLGYARPHVGVLVAAFVCMALVGLATGAYAYLMGPALRFLLGVAPAMLHRRYLVDPTRVNFKEQFGPSTPMACEICAGVAATQVLKLLLGRGKVLAAPRGMHFDAYTHQLRKTHRRRGNKSLYQRLVLAIARRQFRR